MALGGGAGLLVSCWLVVAVMTDALTLVPEAVIMMTGLEGIPVPIFVDRVTLAFVVVSGAPLLLQARVA